MMNQKNISQYLITRIETMQHKSICMDLETFENLNGLVMEEFSKF